MINIGKKIIKVMLMTHISRWCLRLYASAENLFYLSARRGFDPRYSLAGYNNMSSYNPIRTVSGGISLTF